MATFFPDTLRELMRHMEWADACVWRVVLSHPPALQDERLRTLLSAGFRRSVLGPLGRVFPKADWAPRPLRAKATLQAIDGDGAEGYASALSVVPPEMRDMIY